MSPKIKKLNAYYMKKYGITWAERQTIWKKQQGRCAICDKHERHFKNRLSVDHDHRDGRVRGLLCFRCNKFLVGRHTLHTAILVVLYLKASVS